MNDFIRQIKQNALAQMKTQYQNLQESKDTLVAVKCAEKKAAIDEESRELDEALAQYIAEKQTELNNRIKQAKAEANADIAEKREEVEEKKLRNEETAKEAAELEAEAELIKQTTELLAEIKKLEKELE